MVKKMLLIILGVSLGVGSFWAGQAQDPAPQQVRPEPPAVAAQTTQTDLSGTYAGTFDCEPLGLTGATTLTITGNEFTTADGKSGRIVASTTAGYTAVALQVGSVPTGATATATTPTTPPTIVSLRARKSGKRLTLTSVPGATMKCSFVTGRSTARGRRGQQPPAATGTEVANPATPTTTPAESPMPAQTPSPSPTASPTPEPTPTETPTPAPVPTPTGSPTPAPVPTPTGSPTPAPVPTPTGSPTPTPSPTPSPSPSPRLAN